MSFLKKILNIISLSVLGAFVGVLGGFAGACFFLATEFVTDVRQSCKWLILLLPLGGIITVALYSILKLKDSDGANDIIRRSENGCRIRAVSGLVVFVASVITHLTGGSSGREGAALQIGSAGASVIADVFRLKNEKRTVIILCGMSAVFAGVFGTPLTAAVFMLEFRSTRKVLPLSVLPCFVSAIIGSEISSLMGVTSESVLLSMPIGFVLSDFVRIAILAVMTSILSSVTCFVFNKSEHLMKKLAVNPYLVCTTGAVMIVIMTCISGDMRYSGSGMNMVLEAVAGDADWYDFILKTVFTAITLAAGFKGGAIVPTFCIGATFGCAAGSLLGLDSGLAAALGLLGLFCCAAKSPFGAIVLSVEMFGFGIIPYSVIVCIVAWLLSGRQSLFCGRFFVSPIWKIKKNNKCDKKSTD